MLKHRNHQCAAGRHGVYRERKHYTGQIIITISMKLFFFFPWNKTLRGDDRSNSDGPFWCSQPHCRVSKNPQTFAFTYLPAPAITISTLLQSQMRGSTSNKTLCSRKLCSPIQWEGAEAGRLLSYSMLINKALSHTMRGKCLFFWTNSACKYDENRAKPACMQPSVVVY